MSRIVILCEGNTEELALRHFVARQWGAEGLGSVGLQTIDLNGKLETIGPRANRYLDEPQVLAVFTLIDLHGMARVQHEPSDSVEAKVQRVRDWLRSQIQHQRRSDFFPHLGVHQTEAWILADGDALARRLGGAAIRPDPFAEHKNFVKPPATRISEMFVRAGRNRYNKIADGRPLFSTLRFQSVYEHCRYFKSFYDDLRAVGAQ